MSDSHYDRKLQAVGDKVAIRKEERQHEVVRDGIIVPYSCIKGHNLSKGVVESVGRDAAKEGLKKGDVVLFDYFSTYGETYPVCVTKVENVICLCEDGEDD
jgi:co-chaperonin GroES (HSP10)